MTIKPKSESGFQKAFDQLARRLGWRVCGFRKVLVCRPGGATYYATPFDADGKGFPDRVLCRPPRLLFVELKMPSGGLEAEQKLWIDDLEASHDEVYVWRPYQWDEIVRVLSHGE